MKTARNYRHSISPRKRFSSTGKMRTEWQWMKSKYILKMDLHRFQQLKILSLVTKWSVSINLIKKSRTKVHYSTRTVINYACPNKSAAVSFMHKWMLAKMLKSNMIMTVSHILAYLIMRQGSLSSVLFLASSFYLFAAYAIAYAGIVIVSRIEQPRFKNQC